MSPEYAEGKLERQKQEFNLATIVKNNKIFLQYINQKGRAKENLSPLWDTVEIVIMCVRGNSGWILGNFFL